MSWDVGDAGSAGLATAIAQSQMSWAASPNYNEAGFITSTGALRPTLVSQEQTTVINPQVIENTTQEVSTLATTLSNGNGTGSLGTSTGLWDAITGFFGGLFGGGSSGGGGGMDFTTILLLSMMMGGNKGGGMSNMLMMMMMMQAMPSGGLTGGALSNPVAAMLLPRLGTTKAMLLGGPELAMGQMLLKPRAARRRVVYRYPRRRYYRRRWY